MPRHTLLTFSLVLVACPVQQAVDDFFDEFGTQADSSSGTAESSSGDSTSSSTTSADTTSETSTTAGTASYSASEGEADTSTSTSTSTTGEPPSICGNGIPEPGEECDDGNPDDQSDACTTACRRPRLIFITSEVFNGAEVDGLIGADVRCQSAAAKADIPAPENFKALLSDSTTDARDRLFPAEGPYRLINGLQVARDLDALLTETLEHPIDTTEISTDAPNRAWTGTDLGGTAAVGANHCENWHSSSILDEGFIGSPSHVDVWWINIPSAIDNPEDCLNENGLYCLEQE